MVHKSSVMERPTESHDNEMFGRANKIIEEALAVVREDDPSLVVYNDEESGERSLGLYTEDTYRNMAHMLKISREGEVYYTKHAWTPDNFFSHDGNKEKKTIVTVDESGTATGEYQLDGELEGRYSSERAYKELDNFFKSIEADIAQRTDMDMRMSA